jgi:regulator of protease activity HflC (stomatin/prohibitin superfamily)
MITTISFIFIIALLGYFSVSKVMNSGKKVTGEKKLFELSPSILIPLIVVLLIIGSNPFKIVQAGNRGVITTFGNVTGECNSGLKVIVPFVQKVIPITLKPIQVECKIPVGASGAITKDNQTVGIDVIYFYQYESSKITKVFKDFGMDKLESIISNTGTECIKAELGNHAIFDIPINQSKIQGTTIENIRNKLKDYPIIITDLKIINYDWSDEFDKQIQETMHRAQQVKQKEQELLITEQESQKLVKTAEAEKQALVTRAEGEKAAALLMADAKAAEGDGIKKYNELVAKNMSLEIELRKLEIEKIKAERWNGQYVSTNNYGPIPLQNGSLLGK